MSKFTTHLPIPLDETIKLLPAGSHVENVTFNREKSVVEIVWDHANLRSPFTFPQPFPVENLKGDLPDGVKLIAPPKPNIEKTPIINDKVVDNKKAIGKK